MVSMTDRDNTLAYYDTKFVWAVNSSIVCLQFIRQAVYGPNKFRSIGSLSGCLYQSCSPLPNIPEVVFLVMCDPSMNKQWAAKTHRDLCIELSWSLIARSKKGRTWLKIQPLEYLAMVSMTDRDKHPSLQLYDICWGRKQFNSVSPVHQASCLRPQ
jgi:hypothetical protein